MRYQTAVSKEQIARRLRGFEKTAHALSLAGALARICTDDTHADKRISEANEIVASLRSNGISSFFAAEYAKIFSNSSDALKERANMVTSFQLQHGLSEKQAKKLADCIVFSAAKGHDRKTVGILARLSDQALRKGVEFTIVANVVYYSSGNIDAKEFASRCLGTRSRNSSKPASLTEEELLASLLEAVDAYIG